MCAMQVRVSHCRLPPAAISSAPIEATVCKKRPRCLCLAGEGTLGFLGPREQTELQHAMLAVRTHDSTLLQKCFSGGSFSKALAFVAVCARLRQTGEARALCFLLGGCCGFFPLLAFDS